MTLVMFLAVAPALPTIQQHLMLQKQEGAVFSLPGDYWDEGHDFDVLNYDIDMTVDIPNDSVWADVTITLEALSDTLTSLPLHFHWAYTISSCKEGERDLNFNTVMVDTFRIFLDREVAQGETLSVTVSYHGKPSEQKGLFIDESDWEGSVTFTFTEPQGSRYWIPCYDEPSDKAVFTQHITVPPGYDVVANGTLESVEKQGSWWTYTWQEHYPQPTYLIAFAASKYYVTNDTFATVEGEQVPMRTWMLGINDMTDKFKRTPEIVEYFSEIFPPYPFADEKYDQVHAPLGGAMEHTTCTFFNTMANWGANWNWVIAHELSHHWWGDWLTCATWADLWLNEGFATYCEALWAEEDQGQEGYRSYARRIMDIYLDYGQRHPIYDPPWEDLFGTTTYKKGGSVLHMLRQVLGDSVFFAGVNAYAWENADQAVITDDFQETMEEAAGEDLDWFFDEWIYGPGHPHYEIGWRVTHTDRYDVEFAIAQTQNQQVHYFPFRMPLEVAIYCGAEENIFTITDSIGYQRFTLEVDAEPDSFLLDPYDKVLCEITYHDDIDDVPYVPTGARHTDTEPAAALAVDGVFTDLLNVRFSQPSAQQVSIALYDQAGRRLRVFYEGRSTRFYRIYPLADLAAGVYFVRVRRADGSVTSAKTVKLR